MTTLPSRNNTLDIGTKNYRETDIKIMAYIAQLAALSLKIFAKLGCEKCLKMLIIGKPSALSAMVLCF